MRRFMSRSWRAMRGWLSLPERLTIALAGGGILLALILPIWKIFLLSQQYPKGLSLYIHARSLEGDVQNINILNHYIGMKPLSTATFPEFTWMAPVLMGLGALFLLASLVGRRELLPLVSLVLLGFCVFMLWDMSTWLHAWGHELDPRAPMTIDPFTPPTLGYRRIANFTVWSLPNWGGGLIILASMMGPWLLWRNFRRSS